MREELERFADDLDRANCYIESGIDDHVRLERRKALEIRRGILGIAALVVSTA